MQLLVVAVGQRMRGWAADAFDDYAKRMPAEMRIVLREVKAEPRTTAKSPEATMRIERDRIEAAIPKTSGIVALDERGRNLTTEQLAAQLERWRRDGRDLAFLIGGADGLDAELVARADFTLRLSSLTLPHALARVVLAEALYRAWTLSSGHPYHRA